VHGARECAHDYVYYYLAIRSSLSIRHVKLVARQAKLLQAIQIELIPETAESLRF
jgi:hypothetical protein